MKIKFLGAAGTVTGSKYLVEYDGGRVLVDCGLFQGYKRLRLLNWEPFPVAAKGIDAVVLTHAHLDHTGYLPILIREGFKGPIFATAATRDLCEILLRDSGRIQEEDARRANKYGYSKHKPALPLYTEEEAIQALKQFKTFGFGISEKLGGGFTVQASRAGHILGSAILTLRADDTTIVFSGDLGRKENPIMTEPAIIQCADYLIMESTYGNRLHPKNPPEEDLGRIIRETAKRGGTVLIPSFAVGRAQLLLYLIYKLKKSGAIPDLPVFLDSPMAQDATNIMQKHCSEHILSKEECAAVCKSAVYVQSPEESKALYNNKYPSIIISASGMAEGGRVLHHIKHYGPDHHNTIVFAGFQAPMTRGEKMVSGAREVKIHGALVPIRARIVMLETLSSHADYAGVISWLKNFNKAPKCVFLTHGEPTALESLREKIEEEFDWRVSVPYYLEEVDL